MLKLNFNKPNNTALNVLFLGAHSDDIEIGCGGTILRLTSEYPYSEAVWIVFGASGHRVEEAYRSADDFLCQVKEKRVVVKEYRDGFFPYMGGAIKDEFEALKQEFSPDIIFTHNRYDLHQDHRLICELTWNTYRDHLILEYEIPKYDGDLGTPNFFVHLEEAICNKKIEEIILHFQTQQNKHWFDRETLYALLRIRGVESRSPSKYAEAFYCRKTII